MNNLEFHTVKIVNIIEETPLVKRLFLAFDEEQIFQSGQFIILKFEGLQHQFDTRSYSIANFTNGNIIEICVSIKPNGAATPILFSKKIGDTLLSSLPQGRFVLHQEHLSKPHYFICTGTGIAPFRAMVKDLLQFQNFKQAIHLYFGCRTQADLLYYQEFLALEQQYANFKFYPVLSRENWAGNTGYVHPYYLENLKQKPEAIFYLCGWTAMLKETRENLKSIGYERKDIKVEFYD